MYLTYEIIKLDTNFRVAFVFVKYTSEASSEHIKIH